MIHTISRFLCFLFYKIMFGIEAYGRKNIPKKGGFILASNHVSLLDPPALGVACPRKLNYMARHDLFLNRFFSCWLHSVGAFPVKRDSADKSALKEAMKRVTNGGGLLLFPEGARQDVNNAMAGKPGVGFLAAKLNVPVIPAFVKGTDKALPKGVKAPRPHKVSVYFGKEISIERRLPYQDISDEIMRNIRHLAC